MNEISTTGSGLHASLRMTMRSPTDEALGMDYRPRLDLYDRRWEVYNAAEKFVAQVLERFAPRYEHIAELRRSSVHARFLFGSDINDYLKELISHAADLLTWNQLYEQHRTSQPLKEIDKVKEGVGYESRWFVQQRGGALTDKFMQYMDLSREGVAMRNDTDVPEDLDWIKLEGEWDLSASFKKLHDVAKRDAATSEEVLAKRQPQEEPRLRYSHFIVRDQMLAMDGRFDITLASLFAGAGDGYVGARIAQSRKEGKIDVEIHDLDANGHWQPPIPGGFTLKPRISDHGKQMFSVDGNTADLIYPWQAIRKVIDALRERLDKS